MKKQRVPYLDYTANPGDRVRWSNMKGESFEGTLVRFIMPEIDWDPVTAVIKLDDGSEKEVSC
jgi:hypothetical protein